MLPPFCVIFRGAFSLFNLESRSIKAEPASPLNPHRIALKTAATTRLYRSLNRPYILKIHKYTLESSDFHTGKFSLARKKKLDAQTPKPTAYYHLGDPQRCFFFHTWQLIFPNESTVNLYVSDNKNPQPPPTTISYPKHLPQLSLLPSFLAHILKTSSLSLSSLQQQHRFTPRAHDAQERETPVSIQP